MSVSKAKKRINELKNILEGKSQIGQGNIIQAVAHFYRENERTSRTAKKGK